MKKQRLLSKKFTKPGKERWFKGIFDIYDRMRKKAANGPYEVKFDKISLTVLPEVYSPIFFTDTSWFAKELKNIVKDKYLLEIGTGTGAIAIACAMRGARVVATDINPAAVKNAKINVKRHKLDVSVRRGKMYKPLRKKEKFDFIFWSHPFNNWKAPVRDFLLQSGMDYGYKGLKDYILQAKNHLSKNGKLLLGTGDSADLKTIASFAKEGGYSMELLKEINLPLEFGGKARIKYLLYEFKL